MAYSSEQRDNILGHPALSHLGQESSPCLPVSHLVAISIIREKARAYSHITLLQNIIIIILFFIMLIFYCA